jgi:chromosome segregation ATPase
LDSLRLTLQKLATAKLNASAQDEVIQSLQMQKNDLETVVASYEEKMTELEAGHARVVAGMTEAASAERDAHLKAQAEVGFRTEDIETQKVAHAEVVKELEVRSAELKEKSDATVALQARLTTLVAEKEEFANKVSELEVEVLELKETQESLEDVRDGLQSRVDELLSKLTDADAAAGIAADAASKKDAEHSQKLKELSMKHEQELEASAVRVAEITSSLDKSRAEYMGIVNDLNKTKEDIVSKEERHNLKLDEVEKAHADLLAALSSQLEEVSRNLNVSRSCWL